MSTLSTINIADIIKQMQDAQKKANAANEARYTQGLSELTGGRQTLRDLYGRANLLSQDIGQSAARDINEGSQQTGAQGMQGLISSGLGNTTITGAMMRGVESDRQKALARNNENIASIRSGLATQEAGAQMSATGGLADFIAARNDIAPDTALYSNLIQAAMAAGTGKPITVQQGITPAQNAQLNQSGMGTAAQRAGGGGGVGGTGGGGTGGGGTGGGGTGGGRGGTFYAPGSTVLSGGGTPPPTGVNAGSQPPQSGGAAVEGWTDENGVHHIGMKPPVTQDDPGAAVRNWMKGHPGQKLPYTYSMG